jgi:hypothetical protein
VRGLAALPLTSRVPLRVTVPVARRIAGVLAAFRVKVTVTFVGMLIVVKLKTPLGGKGTVTVQGVGLQVGLKGPSAPVLPLLKLCAAPQVGRSRRLAPRRPPTNRLLHRIMTSPPCSFQLFSFQRSALSPLSA